MVGAWVRDVRVLGFGIGVQRRRVSGITFKGQSYGTLFRTR
jgi:hypothetical protein